MNNLISSLRLSDLLELGAMVFVTVMVIVALRTVRFIQTVLKDFITDYKGHHEKLWNTVNESINERHSNEKKFDNRLYQIDELLKGLESAKKTLSKEALLGLIYNDQLPLLKRLSAFNDYLKLGGNGNAYEYAFQNLILDNKNIWHGIVNDNFDEDVDSKNEIYMKVISKISHYLS